MKDESNPPVNIPRPRRLWFWFAGGFLLVFVAILLLTKMTAMHPSGQYAERYPLWKYYGVMVPRQFGPSVLGPGRADTSAMVETGIFHLLFSAAGGCVAVAVGWWKRKDGRFKKTHLQK